MAADGSPTDDPVAAIAGTLLPMGGHKGYGVSVIMDMLSGVLTGSSFGTGVSGPYQADRRSGCGHLMIALDIAAFQPLEAFEARMQAQIAELKSTPLAPGVEEIFFPGELEARADRRQRLEGLILPDDTLADLDRVAQMMDLPQLRPG
jgi:LDH2 family malate/lactate/ureidoglycolate dehydrogenase